MHLTNARTIIISNKIREIRWKIDNTEKSESSINRGGEETNRKGRESSETSCSKVITSTQRRNSTTIPSRMFSCSIIPNKRNYWKRARRQDDGGGRRRWGGGSSRDPLGRAIEAVRIVTKAGAARNFQRDRLSRQCSGGDDRSIPRKDTVSNEKECNRVGTPFKSIQRDQSKFLPLPRSRWLSSFLELTFSIKTTYYALLFRFALTLMPQTYTRTRTQWSEDFAKSDQSPSTPLRALIKRRHRNRPIGLVVS